MLDLRHGVPADRRSRALGWVAWLLVCTGSATLAWSAVQMVGAHVSQRAAVNALAVASPRAEIAPGFTVPTDRPPDVARGAPLAALSIPRLNLSAVVLHGSDAGTLRRGLGHIEHTAMPGEGGNVGIAGHRDSFFWPLRHIQTGDEVRLDTPGGRLRYRVTSFRVVGANHVDVLNPTPHAALTLVTCYPFRFFGSAPDRFVVRAMRVTDATGSPTDGTAGTPQPTGAEVDDVATRVPLLPARTQDIPLKRTGASQPEPSGTTQPAESAVILAIERFRQAYNTTRARRDDAQPSNPLFLEPCDLAVVGKEATATCHSAAVGPDSAEPAVWVFRLAKADREWLLKSVTRR